MNSIEAVFTEDPPLFLLKSLTVQIVKENERPLANELLERDHYLGELPQGSMLMQVVEHEGRWVGRRQRGQAETKGPG